MTTVTDKEECNDLQMDLAGVYEYPSTSEGHSLPPTSSPILNTTEITLLQALQSRKLRIALLKILSSFQVVLVFFLSWTL